MFSKRRTTAALLIVGFLVASLGMFTPSTEAHHDCESAKDNCCYAIWRAKDFCSRFPYSSGCYMLHNEANYLCAIAAAECTTFTCTDTIWGG